MWGLIVSVPDHCLSFYFRRFIILNCDRECVCVLERVYVCKRDSDICYALAINSMPVI